MTFDADGSDRLEICVSAYTARAARYAEEHAGKMADRVERFAAALPIPSRILDAGCGPGRDLARFAAFGHEPVGVDLNPEFVAMAAAHAPTLQVDLRELSGRFEMGSFDGVWACASLVHLDDVAARDVLDQIATLLRPAGTLYACVKAEGETGWLDEPDGRRWYRVWGAGEFADTVSAAGLTVDEVVSGPFVEVWATKAE